MANRRFNQFMFSLNPMLTMIEGSFKYSGSIQELKGSGIKSIDRISTGLFKIKLDDNYNKLLSVQSSFISLATSSGVDSVEISSVLPFSGFADGGAEFHIQCFNAGALTDPAATSTLQLMIFLRNSSLLGKGE